MNLELRVVGEACRVILVVTEFEVQWFISYAGCNQFNSVVIVVTKDTLVRDQLN